MISKEEAKKIADEVYGVYMKEILEKCLTIVDEQINSHANLGKYQTEISSSIFNKIVFDVSNYDVIMDYIAKQLKQLEYEVSLNQGKNCIIINWGN